MTETPELSIYESTFTKSDKTDAILLIDEKKLHVNKALLSYHSDFFNVLFNSDFKEKSMEEIPIKDVSFQNFATVLSLVHGVPIEYTWHQAEAMLEIADRFHLPAVKRYLELFLMTYVTQPIILVTLADKYQLTDLMDFTLSQFTTKTSFFYNFNERCGPDRKLLDGLSKETRAKIFDRILEIDKLISVEPKAEDPLRYEKAFAKSDKTDAILVVDDGKKMHVNKAILSHHSDYFNALFNSEFKEKAMEEIEIKDVKFEDFATLLSCIQQNLIMPTKENVENVLELADRFAIFCVKFYLEPFLITFSISVCDDIRIGDKYGMTDLIKKRVGRYTKEDFKTLTAQPFFKDFSADTKSEMLYQYLKP